MSKNLRYSGDVSGLNFTIVMYETSAGKGPFSEWLDSLDGSVRGKVIARIDRLGSGQFGNTKSLKGGLYEIKFKAPAFRIYYAMIDTHILLLITGGDKSRQSADIKKARWFLEDYRNRYEI